jgi:putative glutamine amidotransferase
MEPAALLPQAYPQAVAAGGGLPVLLPSMAAIAARPAEVLDRLDGLVLSGGPDVDPAAYGADPHEQTSAPRAERDAAEMALLATAMEAGMPVLCICRGLQLLNVARGGTLVQHLPDVTGHTGHAPAPGTFGQHEVKVDPESRLAAVLGTSRVDVATAHHQAIGELGQGLTVAARALDGTIEAIEDVAEPYLVGVQWHPEAGTDLALMRSLVSAASRYREGQCRQ